MTPDDVVNGSSFREYHLLLRNHMSAEAARRSIPALRNEIEVSRLVGGAWMTHTLDLKRLMEAVECTELGRVGRLRSPDKA